MEDEGKQWMNKASNQLLVSALDNCDIISAFTVLLRLMTQAHVARAQQKTASNNEKFTEMVTRCLLRLTKRLISTAALFDWSRTVQLLKETNSFLVQHPGEDILCTPSLHSPNGTTAQLRSHFFLLGAIIIEPTESCTSRTQA